MMKQRSHERRTSTSSSGGGGHLPYIDQSPAKEEAQRDPPVSGPRAAAPFPSYPTSPANSSSTAASSPAHPPNSTAEVTLRENRIGGGGGGGGGRGMTRSSASYGIQQLLQEQ